MSHFLIIRRRPAGDDEVHVDVVEFVERAPEESEIEIYRAQSNGVLAFVQESDKSKEDFCQGLLKQLSRKEYELTQSGALEKMHPINIHGSTALPEFCDNEM